MFTTLDHALDAAWAIALPASFVWGVLSVVLSPCHLASIPLIVGFISKQQVRTTRRALATSCLFALGILVTIAAVGAITALAGTLVGELDPRVNYVVAGIFFLVGLHLLGVIPMPFSAPGSVSIRRKGLLAALLLGLIYGLVLGPCTFAYMIPVLAVAFRAAADNGAYAAALLGVYGIGHCAVIVLAGTSAGWVQRYLNWNETSKATAIVRGLCGAGVLAGGLYLLYLA